MNKFFSVAFVTAALVGGCGESGPDAPEGVAAGSSGKPFSDDKSDSASFYQCIGRSFSPAPHYGFNRISSRLYSALGNNVHSSQDVVAQPGSHPSLTAKFAYGGLLSKDLEGEWVWVFIDWCDGWHYMGYAKTDGSGRINFTIPWNVPAGVYGLRIEVVGDGTSVESTLWMLPRGTHLAVFDIDGTLTKDDGEIWEQLFAGSTPEEQAGAADLTWAELSRKELNVYLTGRPYYLANKTRGWLQDLGFAPGIAHFAPSNAEWLPTNSGVGDYKKAFLNALKANGEILDVAYGNATTDIYAYTGAGMRASDVWIIGSNGGRSGTRAVSGGWSSTVTAVNARPVAKQPF